MSTKTKILTFLLILCSFIVNLVVYAQDDEGGVWAEVIDEDGNIRYDDLTDLGEIQVEAEWMPDLPFFEGQATYHRYLTASGNIVVMPSASTLFFMALHPDESGLNGASYALGNGLGVLETMLAGYVSPTDMLDLGYARPEDFYRALIAGEVNLFTFDFMGEFLLDLLDQSMTDLNLYTMLLLYTREECNKVPGGCPAGLGDIDLPTLPPPVCPPPYIETWPIQVSGGSAEGGKLAPEHPVVIGQDPERRGVDLQVNAIIPPVAHHTFEVIVYQDPVCAVDNSGKGSGCPDHPGDPHWKTVYNLRYECEEHVQVFPDYLGMARVTVSLTEASRQWILTELFQSYPGAFLIQPEFSFAYAGPGTLTGNQSISWTKIIPSIQTADPGQYETTVFIRTAGTPVSAPRQVQLSLGHFSVALVRVTLIEEP